MKKGLQKTTTMNNKNRIKLAMSGEKPDRVPVMCEMAKGHIYKHAGLSPIDFWCTPQGFALGNIKVTDLYRFDGILADTNEMLNFEDISIIDWINETDNGHIAKLNDGCELFFPHNDNPRFSDDRHNPAPVEICDVDIGKVDSEYSAVTIPSHHRHFHETIISQKAESHSVHGEVGTAFGMLLDMTRSYENGLIALIDNPDKCIKLMEIFNRYIIDYALYQCQNGIDALKLSSPFAGSGFISRDMYVNFVLPFEQDLINAVKSQFSIPCYLHTCGKIGDRLDLMLKTGIDGIECLDPAPLGDVDLKHAVDEIGKNVFIKGNLDSVNELVGKERTELEEIIHARIEIGKKAEKGFILSTACSVSPIVPMENIFLLYECAEKYGKY